ncbi:MAG TPA: site-specific DNA-methyltransferase [Acidimicrobiales bacterium]|nr:site-specific DNA-methyltransferase [Acidimicrobiales bacterium]
MADRPERRSTATSNFGVGRREAHDATAFYARFGSPEISSADDVARPEPIGEPFRHGDARSMTSLSDNSVALVVTSPPYFAGKQYEEELGRDGVPSSYLEYLTLLRDVFAECKRVLEPGGRIAVNVANLGRRPYRSLASDVIRILQDDLGLLLRGEIVWQKGDGASGSCAWGSFRSPANPVLRDLTERVIVASKGRFDRARSAKQRRAEGLPHEATLTSDEFMAATLDVWEMNAESARRVNHPAPFPVELPRRLIDLYTYADDLVLDPFMGSGSTLVAASRARRRYVGYDLDASYCDIARERVALEGQPSADAKEVPDGAVLAIAERALGAAGFEITGRAAKQRGLGLAVAFEVRNAFGVVWYVDVAGSFTTARAGLDRTDAALRAVGRAHVLRETGRPPLMLLTPHVPKPGSDADRILRSAGPKTVFDVLELLSDEANVRLAAYAQMAGMTGPLPGFWYEKDIGATAIG